MPGRGADAIAEYQAALRFQPNLAEAHANLGSALARTPGRLSEAMAQFEAALRLDPNSVAAHVNLGNALAKTVMPAIAGEWKRSSAKSTRATVHI